MSETNISINESHSAGSKILEVTGRLDANSSGSLDSHLSNLIENNAQRILGWILVVLIIISSAGLRVFISNAKKLKLSGGKISLCSIQPHVMEVFDMSGFSSIFDIYRSEEDYLSAGIDNFTFHDEPSTDQERNKLVVLKTYLDGRRMTTPWMSFFTLEDGKISKAIHVYDRLDEQRQLNG